MSESDLARMLKRQRILGDFGDFALRSQDLNQILHKACRLVAEALNAGRAKILEIQHSPQQLLVKAGTGWDADVVGTVHLPMEDHSSETFAIKAGKPVISQNINQENRFQVPAFMKEAGVVALVNAPIFLPGGRPFGLLQVDAAEPRDFDEEDIQFLRTYTAILGPVIDRLLMAGTLHSTEQRFRLTVEQVLDYVILVSDAQDRIVDWLPGAETVFGWTAAEALGQPAALIYTAEDRETSRDRREAELARDNGIVPVSRWYLRKDRQRIFIEGSVRALRAQDNTLLGFLRIGQDMTERLLIEGMPQLIWRSRDGGHWNWASPQWLKYSGQGQQETHGLSWLEVVHPDDQAATMEAWREAHDRGELSVEHRLRRSGDGSYRWHHTRSVPMYCGGDHARCGDCTVEWLGTSTDIDDLKRLQERQTLLVAELHHRTRNLLTVAQAIVMRSLGHHATPKNLIERLISLGRVQSLLSQSRDDEVGLMEIIRLELKPYERNGDGRIIIAGPAVVLPGERVQDLALVLHELTTNAVKHGALKSNGGCLEVRWTIAQSLNAESLLTLDWCETGVVMPTDVSRRGYGRVLIERALSRSAKSTTRFAFGTNGVHCRIEMLLVKP